MIEAERVAHWTWKKIRAEGIDDLRQLAQRTDLGNHVLQLCVDMRLPAHEYDEAERLIQDLAGSEARPGRAGVFEIDRERFELDTTNFDQYRTTLPAVLQATVTELKTAAEDPSQRSVAERALYHLYRLSIKKAS